MFHLGDKQPDSRVWALCAAVAAALLCSCAQRTATSPENAASGGGPGLDADLPVVVITAQREKPLRLAAKADSKSAPDAN
jgi:hypothetical protein